VVPEEVLDLFAVPDDVHLLAGDRTGTGAEPVMRSVVAGDLVLSPDRDRGTCACLSPLLAQLAMRMDERPRRADRDLRLAVPVPARDGSWVVDGWAASRWEPGTRVCDDLGVVRAAGRVLHAELASAVPVPPPCLVARDDARAEAERLALDVADRTSTERAAERATRAHGPGAAALVEDLLAVPYDDPAPQQLVHADLMGHVLLDAAGAPVVVDVVPSWRSPLWAEAVAVLDAVAHWGVEAAVLRGWSTAVERGALARAAAYRLLAGSGSGYLDVARRLTA